MGSNIQAIPSENGIFDVIRAVDRGNTVLDLEEGLRDVVNEIIEQQGGTGSVTLSLTLSLDPQTAAVKVVAEVKSKLPKRKKRGSLFFATPEGNLTRANPNQRDMFPEQMR